MPDMKAVKFDHFGDVDVLEVRHVPRPSPGTGEVLVAVKAAGINPGETVIRRGAMPVTLPSGPRRRIWERDHSGWTMAVGDPSSFVRGGSGRP
jgi:NADPH:quinone reductase-like Zn-dependent oxidoreductase